MKQHVLLIVLLTITTLCYAQKTKKVKHTVKYESDIQPYNKHKETYYVLKSDKSIKQGEYVLKSNKHLLIEGWYKNNLKDSLWTYRFFGNSKTPNKVRAQGHYKKGTKVGIWNYYDYGGELEQRFDYNKDSILLSTRKIRRDTILPVKTDEGYKLLRVDTPPIFKEGSCSMPSYFNLAREYIGDQSPVNKRIFSTIQFEVDSLGVMSNFTIKQGNYDFYNQYTLKRVKQLPNEWIPAKINGKPTTVLWTIVLSDVFLGELD